MTRPVCVVDDEEPIRRALRLLPIAASKAREALRDST